MPKVRPAALFASVLLAAVCLGCAPGDPTPAPLPGRPAQQESEPAAPAPSAEAEPTERLMPGTRVSLGEDAGLGPILVDAQGRTLYLFAGDTSTQSTCYEECAAQWPPLTTKGVPVAGTGVDDGLLGVGKRTDGTEQVLYKGHPLYYFAEDTEPGQVGGQLFDRWFTVNALGDKVLGG
ncbi:hypothetical protein [Kitasatospora sp. NPDC051914]|uniref:COG4315 family predicted lipoprotein n=1 Tax=Kitasatospora sp. NPDC051914 TaxID=3154945 RepID=UPI00343790C3